MEINTVNVVIILISCIFSIQGSEGAQRFDEQPDYREVNPGQQTRLTCKIFGKKGQCSWQKDGKPVGIYPGKYEWAGNPDLGDCTIRVLNAAIEYDDGEWECQVTASDFAAQDALTSRPVKLVVREPPTAPQIQFNETVIATGRNLTTATGHKALVKCVSRNGNPAANIKWFVGDKEIFGAKQKNKTEEENSKKWRAVSYLNYTFHREHNSKELKCVAVHEAYPTKSRKTEVILNIQYGPKVELFGAPKGDLEENKDHVTLKCKADANPPATIVWRKAGRPEIYSFQETLEFRPLLRKHAGAYTCEAKNYLGTTKPIKVDLDVKYAPKITRIGPEPIVTAPLYNRTVLVCQAEGNPPPSYQWLQKTSTPKESVYVRGVEHMLVIHNVTYDYQGEYFCKATNIIAGKERVIRSQSIDLSIFGAPQVLRHSVERVIAVEQGKQATISVLFCSNPPPTNAIWEWGSMELKAGYEAGRFTAHELTQSEKSDCYEARLGISRSDSSDSRHYFLNVENSEGSDRYSVILKVRGFDFVFADPVSMATVIGVIVACLLLLVLFVSLILYSFRADKWCFSQRGDFKPTDLESEKSDMDSSLRDGGSGGGHVVNGKGFGSLPQAELQISGRKTPQGPLMNLNPNESPDLHIMKQQQQQSLPQPQQQYYEASGRSILTGTPGERSFQRSSVAYLMDPMNKNRGDINYSDLQLPRTSNNGSMKKGSRHNNNNINHPQPNQHQSIHHAGRMGGHHAPSPLPRSIHVGATTTTTMVSGNSAGSGGSHPSPNPNKIVDYPLQFKPKSNEQAEV